MIILLKKAQANNKSNFGKHQMLKFYMKHKLASKSFLFNKKNKWKFSLNLCLGNLTVQEIKV
jgi:hypothetical protein